MGKGVDQKRPPERSRAENLFLLQKKNPIGYFLNFSFLSVPIHCNFIIQGSITLKKCFDEGLGHIFEFFHFEAPRNIEILEYLFFRNKTKEIEHR